MPPVICPDSSKELPLDPDNYPTCVQCKNTFHFEKCSGMDESAWAKRGSDRRLNWVCHRCNPDKNMSRSKSGLSQQSQSQAAPQPGVSNPVDTNVTPVRQNVLGSATDPASKKRAVEEIASPPLVLPEFDNLDDKLKYVLDFCLKTMASNVQLVLELRQFKDDMAASNERHAADAARITALEKAVRVESDKNADLELKVNALEDYSRADNLLLHGVPSTNSETEAMNVVISAAKVVGIVLQHRDFNACHSLGPRRSGSTRIVCKFVHRWLRNQVRGAVNKGGITTADLGFPGEPNRVFMTDHLSPDSAKFYGEVKSALSSKSGGNYDYIWTKNRKIFVKLRKGSPSIEITSITQVKNLQEQQNNQMDVVQST